MSSAPPPEPISEAAGLLRSGVIFPRRVGLKPVGDPRNEADILLGLKRGAFSVYFGDAPLLHFDLDGRWQRAFIAGTHYLKGLDTQTRAIERVREGDALVLRRRTLPPAETVALDAAIVAPIQVLQGQLAAGQFDLVPPPPPSQAVTAGELAATLNRVVGWDAAAWDDQRARYGRAYGPGPAPFLPPDCPNPVILQAAAGMTAEAFSAHARGVATLLGSRLNQCRDIFLTGLGWFDRPAEEVVSLLAAVAAVFPIEPNGKRPRALDAGADAPRLATIHGWLDALPADRPSPAPWSRFRAAHLGRVTVRVDAALLADRTALETTIAALKAAGIGVGLAVWVDPSGFPAESLGAAISVSPLAAGDLIALIATDGGEPASLAALKDQLTAALPPGARGPRVVVYNLDKQWI